MHKSYPIFITAASICLALTTSVYAEDILSWDECIAEAKKNNPQLISAVEVIKGQQAQKSITASGLFPQISASASGSTSKTTTPGSEGTPAISSTTDSYSYGANASQLVFDGFKTINNVKAASENVNAARQNFKFVSSDVRLNLRTAFVNLLKAQEFIRVTEDIVKIRRDSYELITLRYQSGLEHRGALLTAEANLAQAMALLEQAKRDIESSQRQLSKELGGKQFSPMRVKGDFSVREDPSAKPKLDEIVKNNPSVLEAAAKKNAASYNIKSAYGNFSPTLSGGAGVGKFDSHWSPEGKQFNAGLDVSLPIFEGGLRTAQLAQAKAAYQQANADERSIRDTALVNLAQSWALFQDAVDQVVVNRKFLEASEERSKIAEAQYSIGFISFDNWIIIQNDLVLAKRAYLESQANALYAEAGWIQAKGETLEYAQ
jgi:TolC family type I secretion outer membrane protein